MWNIWSAAIQTFTCTYVLVGLGVFVTYQTLLGRTLSSQKLADFFITECNLCFLLENTRYFFKLVIISQKVTAEWQLVCHTDLSGDHVNWNQDHFSQHKLIECGTFSKGTYLVTFLNGLHHRLSVANEKQLWVVALVGGTTVMWVLVGSTTFNDLCVSL